MGVSILYSPFHLSPVLLLLTGFCVGTLSSFFGIGGGWLITPILHIIGLPTPYAIGTSLVYIVITAVFGTIRHRKLKNVNFIIGIIIGLSSIGGILCGRQLILFLERQGWVDTLVRILYMVFLSATGIYMLTEKTHKEVTQRGKKKGVAFSPVLHIENDLAHTMDISVPLLFLIGIGVGFMSSTMGVGGGFILFPLLIYVLGLPVTLAVGTSLLAVLIIGVQGATVYIASQRIDWSGVFYMTITTILGAYLGSSATKRVNPDRIKKLFACTVLGGVIAVGFKQLEIYMFDSIVIFSIAVFSTLAIIYSAFIKKSH